MPEKNYWQLVVDRENELLALTSRMDKDRDLVYLTDYVMKMQDGQEAPRKHVHNVTLNDPLTFYSRAIANISSTYQQIVVDGKELEDRDTTYIEEFLDAFLTEADNLLLPRDITRMFQFLGEQSCLRGRLCARCLVRTVNKDGKKVIVPDISPWDTRFVSGRPNPDGWKWLGYKMPRSAEEIWDDYQIEIRGSSGTVLDVYDRTHNEIWIDGQQVKRKVHPFPGYVPVVFVTVPSGTMLQDTENIGHDGESIFSQDRGLYNEMNKAVTVLQTLNMMSFLGPLQYESEAGTSAQLPDQPPMGVGAVVAVEKGAGFKSMPITDIRNATRQLLAILEGRLQRGSLPAVDYGNLTFPLSAVAISKLTESKDQIYVPRLQALAMFYQQLCSMVIRQYIQTGVAAELGEEGHRTRYDPKKLQGAYTIKFNYYSQQQDQVIANYTVAQAAVTFVSGDTIRRDILKLPNPDGEKQKMRAETAESLDPVIAMHRHVHSLIDEGNDIEARILAGDVVNMLKQRAMASIVANQPAEKMVNPQEKAKGKSLIPLLAEGGGSGRYNEDTVNADEEELHNQAYEQRQADSIRERRAVESGVD